MMDGVEFTPTQRLAVIEAGERRGGFMIVTSLCKIYLGAPH